MPAGATFSLRAWLCQDRPVAGRRGRDRCGPPMETAVQRSDRPTEHDTHAPAGLNQKTTPDIPESAGMLIVGPSLPLGMKSPPGENYRTDRAWVTTSVDALHLAVPTSERYAFCWLPSRARSPAGPGAGSGGECGSRSGYWEQVHPGHIRVKSGRRAEENTAVLRGPIYKPCGRSSG